jgi:hypothetical protein
MKSAKLKEHLTSGHPENAYKDVGFIVPFHRNLFYKHPIMLPSGLPNKTSSTLL